MNATLAINTPDWIQIVPASFNIELLKPYSSPGGDKTNQMSVKGKLEHENIVALSTLGKLAFSRPLIAAGDKRIFGSVSVDDIIAELRDAHGISLERGSVQIVEGRIKEVGTYQAKIKLSGTKEVALDINVIPE
jgi:ribosomal protein L9